MTETITGSWARIERWLARHAPATYAELAPPASRSAIAETGEVIGMALPEPLAESLLRHDGTGHRDVLPPFWSLMSAEDIADEWQMKVEIGCEEEEAEDDGNGDDDFLEGGGDDEEDDDALAYGPWWHRRWIPFAADGRGDALVLDQRGGRLHGRVGDADHEEGCTFERHAMWSSLPALLEAVAGSLETGGALDDSYKPFVNDEGALEWEVL